MRHLFFAGCAVVALQSLPAMALTEPEQMRPDAAQGDDRVRLAWWQPGKVIKLASAQGQSLMVEMPKGMALQAFMLSEQNIIKPEEYEEIDPATGEARPKQTPNPANKEEGCTATVDLKVCVRRERFLFFIPFVPLSTQPVPMLMIEKKKVGKKGKETEEEIEHSIIFELSTVAENARPYYGVKVVAGEAPKPVEPKPAVATAQARPDTMAPANLDDLLANRQRMTPIVRIPAKPGMPRQDRERLKELERAREQPPMMNNKYIIQGDENLIGR